MDGHLRGARAVLFRQSEMGGVWHIAANGDDAIAERTRWITAMSAEDAAEGMRGRGIRILTYCGKNLKYGLQSVLLPRSALVHNACERCFETHSLEREDNGQREAEVSQDDLPF